LIYTRSNMNNVIIVKMCDNRLYKYYKLCNESPHSILKVYTFTLNMLDYTSFKVCVYEFQLDIKILRWSCCDHKLNDIKLWCMKFHLVMSCKNTLTRHSYKCDAWNIKCPRICVILVLERVTQLYWKWIFFEYSKYLFEWVFWYFASNMFRNTMYDWKMNKYMSLITCRQLCNVC